MQRDAGSSYPVGPPRRGVRILRPAAGAGVPIWEYAKVKHQKALRNALLLALYRQSRGDLAKNMSVRDVAESLKEKEEDLELVASQLVEIGLLKPTEAQLDPFTVFRITMRGIEEGEKMDQSHYKRLADKYPFAID